MAKQPTEYDYGEAEAAGLGYMRHCLIQSSAIDDVRVNDSMLKVLVALGSYASRKNSNWCWAKEQSIADRLGVSRQMVSRAANALARCGYIEIKHAFREDGGQVSSSYRILLDFELAAEHRRQQGERPRAGIGGRKKGAPRNSEFTGGYNSEFTGGATPEVAGGATPEVAGGATPEVAGGATPEVAPLNPESENGFLKRNKKIPSLHSVEKKTQETPHLEPPSVKPITEIHRTVGDTPPPPIPPPPAPAPPAQEAIGPVKYDGHVWAQVKLLMGPSMSDVQRREYLDRCDLLRAAPGQYMILAPTSFVAEACETRFGGHFRAALHKVVGTDASLTFQAPRGKVRA